MIKKIAFLICLELINTSGNAQLNLLGSAQNGATNAANGDANQAGSSAVNNTVSGIFGSRKKAKKDTAKANSQQSNSSDPSGPSASTDGSTVAPSAQSDYKAYSNYDFVPGDTVIFADDFADDQDGEYPAHWNLNAGQGILNKVATDEGFCVTESGILSPGYSSPRMKTKSYLTSGFTVEFNFYPNNSDGVRTRFLLPNGNDAGSILFDNDGSIDSREFAGPYKANFPGDSKGFKNKWHHCALIVKNGTIKCYVDQYRVLVIPNIDFAPASVQFGGYGPNDNPVIFNNVRIASGGNMNSVAKKFTDAKIVTHGINFDIDKATIQAQSMGTLNMIVKVMQNNPDLKFEVDGHTDNSGNTQHNMELSQQRADEVKKQLVSMGIDVSRLTTKGFGDTKPISSNDTPDGKSNNRRVEFVRI